MAALPPRLRRIVQGTVLPERLLFSKAIGYAMEWLAFFSVVALIVVVAVMWPRLRKLRLRNEPEASVAATDAGWVELPAVSVQDMISGRGAANAIASGRVSDAALQATIGGAFPGHPETAFAVFVRLRALYCTVDKMVELSLVPGVEVDQPDLLELAASERVVLIENRACFDPEQFARHLQVLHQ
jgi:hypothetical protein